MSRSGVIPASQATDGQNHPRPSSTAMGSVVVAAATSEIPIEVSPLPAGPIRPSTRPGVTVRSIAGCARGPWPLAVGSESLPP